MYDCLRMELAAEGEPVAVTTILPATIDTPFFEHARSKVGHAMPKGLPPVYAPEVVARAVARAAVRPTREVPVGGSAVGFSLGQRFRPAVTDAVLSVPQLQRAALTDRRPDNGTDDLDAPVPGTGRTTGQSRGPVLQHSAFTACSGSSPAPESSSGPCSAAPAADPRSRTRRTASGSPADGERAEHRGATTEL